MEDVLSSFRLFHWNLQLSEPFQHPVQYSCTIPVQLTSKWKIWADISGTMAMNQKLTAANTRALFKEVKNVFCSCFHSYVGVKQQPETLSHLWVCAFQQRWITVVWIMTARTPWGIIAAVTGDVHVIMTALSQLLRCSFTLWWQTVFHVCCLLTSNHLHHLSIRLCNAVSCCNGVRAKGHAGRRTMT